MHLLRHALDPRGGQQRGEPAFLTAQQHVLDLHPLYPDRIRARLTIPVRVTPAAKSAGYELRKLTDRQPAGLIDDQLRVRLRTARFVVADLTDNNRGAYWEAGFAEGLGTPVIYSCERSVFESADRRKGTHFDTNHLVTVLWDESNLQAAADELKAHIRATLPTEAKLED